MIPGSLYTNDADIDRDALRERNVGILAEQGCSQRTIELVMGPRKTLSQPPTRRRWLGWGFSCEALGEFMADAGLTPTQLAQRTGIDRACIVGILKAEHIDPSDEQVEKLAAALGICLEELFWA